MPRTSPGEARAYRAWYAMVRRCTNPSSSDYPNYGGRGITLCRRWLTFTNFLKDMGEAPLRLSLGRIDNNGPYSPSNCRWETSFQQSINKRNTLMVKWYGEMIPLIVLCKLTGSDFKLAKIRIFRAGWAVKKALETPAQKRPSSKPAREVTKKVDPLKALCESANLPIHIVKIRIKTLKWSLEKALSTPVGAIRGRKPKDKGDVSMTKQPSVTA